MPTEAKKQTVNEMQDRLAAAGSVYLTAFQGLTVNEADELRGKLIEAGSHMQVVKNRLLRIAVKGTPFEHLGEALTGPNAITYCGEDMLAPLKVLAEFANAHGQPPVKAAVVEGRVLSPQQIERLSKVPAREQLVAEVVWAFAGPVNDLVRTLSAVVADVVYTLQAIVDEKGGAEAA